MNEHIKQIQAHAVAVQTGQRERLEELRELIALPGVRVVVIRRPWTVGLVGTVLGVWSQGPRLVARVDFDGRVMSVPLDALARRHGAPDCATAQIWHTAAFVRLQSGEFLE